MATDATVPTDPRLALQAIGQLDDEEIDLADAAVQLARVDAPEADWQATGRQLSALARDAVEAASAVGLDDLPGRAAALARVVAGRHGYAGDSATYDDLSNANLIRVVERRKGLPVALGILWLHAAQAAGWPAHGIDFPGHFLVALQGRAGQAVIDVFAGGVLRDARDLRALIKRVEGPAARLRPGVLEAIGSRAVLLRLQNNILARRLRAGELPAAMIGLEDMLRIAPAEVGLWREAALLNQRLDRVGAAIECFERCLALRPAGEAAAGMRAAMDELRTRLN